MIELRNRQYMTIIDCLAGEALEVGNVVELIYNLAADRLSSRAMKATDTGGISAIAGPLFAHWINDRSTAVAYSGGEDGLSFPLAAAADPDANHYIPSGSRMVAVGGKGVAEIRFFKDSLDTEYASTLPDPMTVLRFSDNESKLCSASNGSVVATDVALVLETDAVSISVLIG